VGALIGFALAIFNFAIGLWVHFDDSWSSETSFYGYQLTRDGLPTLLGWVFELLDLLNLTLAGVIGGLVARVVAVPRGTKGQ
jgi:hypothetical protein